MSYVGRVGAVVFAAFAGKECMDKIRIKGVSSSERRPIL